MVPRRALRPHPGVEVSLAFSLNPAPHGCRFGVRAVPAVPTRVVSFELRVLPRRLESACASYPAYSPCGSIRLALRHFLLDLPRARRWPSPLAGFQLRSRGPAVFPLGYCRLTFICAGLRQVPLDSFRIVALRLPSGCSEPIAFAESFFPLSGSLGTQVMF